MGQVKSLPGSQTSSRFVELHKSYQQSKHKGATETLKHSQTLTNNWQNTQSQRHSPKQTSNKPTTLKHRKKKKQRHKEYVPSVKERQELQIARQTPSKRNKSPSENSRVSLRKNEGTQKVEEESTLRKNAVGKCNSGHSMLFIEGQPLGIPNDQLRYH